MSREPLDEQSEMTPAAESRFEVAGSPQAARLDQPILPIDLAKVLLRVEDVALVDRGGARVFSSMTFNVDDGDRLLILGRRKVGKSALIELLAGSIAPTSGRITRSCRVSFPLGQLPRSMPHQTIDDYIRSTTEQYGGVPEEVIDFFDKSENFGFDRGQFLCSLDDKASAKISMVLGLSIPFDIYLMDDYSPALLDDVSLAQLLAQRASAASFVFSSRFARGIKDLVNKIAIISEEGVTLYGDIRAGLSAHRSNMSGE